MILTRKWRSWSYILSNMRRGPGRTSCTLGTLCQDRLPIQSGPFLILRNNAMILRSFDYIALVSNCLH